MQERNILRVSCILVGSEVRRRHAARGPLSRCLALRDIRPGRGTPATTPRVARGLYAPLVPSAQVTSPEGRLVSPLSAQTSKRTRNWAGGFASSVRSAPRTQPFVRMAMYAPESHATGQGGHCSWPVTPDNLRVALRVLRTSDSVSFHCSIAGVSELHVLGAVPRWPLLHAGLKRDQAVPVFVVIRDDRDRSLPRWLKQRAAADRELGAAGIHLWPHLRDRRDPGMAGA